MLLGNPLFFSCRPCLTFMDGNSCFWRWYIWLCIFIMIKCFFVDLEVTYLFFCPILYIIIRIFILCEILFLCQFKQEPLLSWVGKCAFLITFGLTSWTTFMQFPWLWDWVWSLCPIDIYMFFGWINVFIILKRGGKKKKKKRRRRSRKGLTPNLHFHLWVQLLHQYSNSSCCKWTYGGSHADLFMSLFHHLCWYVPYTCSFTISILIFFLECVNSLPA